VQYGAGVKARVLYLQQYQLLPYQRIAQVMRDLFGGRLSTGTDSQLCPGVRRRAGHNRHRLFTRSCSHGSKPRQEHHTWRPLLTTHLALACEQELILVRPATEERRAFLQRKYNLTRSTCEGINRSH
jgi:hypothetical protein